MLTVAARSSTRASLRALALLSLATICIVLVGSSEARAQRQCDDDASFDTFDSSVAALEALLAEKARGGAPDATSTDQLLKDLMTLSRCEGRLGRRALFYRAQLYGLRGELVEELHTVQRLRERDLGPEEVKELNALYPPTQPPGDPTPGRSIGPIDRVKRGQAVGRSDFARASCQDLWIVRNWVYARHGYAFSTDRAQRFFGAQPDYARQSAVSAGTVARYLSDTDAANRDLLVAIETEQGCRR